MTAAVKIRIDLNPGSAAVTLWDDGEATVELSAVMVCGKDVTGDVCFAKDGSVVNNYVEDSFVYVPLKPRVLRAAENRALLALKKARKQLAVVHVAHR